MADTTISGIATAVTTVGKADLFETEQSATTKKVTALQLQEFVSDKGADVAVAGTVVLGDGEYFHLTGTGTITDIDFTDSWDGRRARVIFDSSGVILTHNATSLILPGGANIVTSAGDSATFVVETGDNVKCMQFERASGLQLSNPTNASTAAQTPTAATSTYLTGSALAIPGSKLRIGTTFRWNLLFTKTAAGTAATTFFVRLGTAGSVADTAILTFNALPVGTAAIDEAWIEILLTCRGPLSSSGVLVGSIYVGHMGQPAGTFTTGFIITTTYFKRLTSSTFDVTTANLIAGISVTSGASVALTFEQITAESFNL